MALIERTEGERWFTGESSARSTPPRSGVSQALFRPSRELVSNQQYHGRDERERTRSDDSDPDPRIAGEDDARPYCEEENEQPGETEHQSSEADHSCAFVIDVHTASTQLPRLIVLFLSSDRKSVV